MISSTSLPIVVIFERHWDETPRRVVKGLIPKLADEGYNTFCFESPQDLTDKERLSFLNESLKEHIDLNSQAEKYLQRVGFRNIKLSDISFGKLAELMQLYVSSQRYLHVAEVVKGLPAEILFNEITKSVHQYSYSLKGIDIDFNDYLKIVTPDVDQRMDVIEKNEEYRIKTIAENLFKLFAEKKGVIFVCGALHAENLMNKFKEYNLHEHVLYYHPHSDKNYDDSLNDIKTYLSNDTLKNHTFCLKSEKENALFVDKIIKEVKSKNIGYIEEVIGGNTHSALLSDFFQKDFKVFMRPGYYVDALLNIDHEKNSDEIATILQKVNVLTHRIALAGNTYLVVPNVNTPQVASNIRLLK